MKIRKNMKFGVSFIFLLLIFTSCISLINLPKNSNLLEENTLPLDKGTMDGKITTIIGTPVGLYLL
jgi:hypothetical protein